MKKKLTVSILIVTILLGAISMTALVMRNSKQSSHSVSHSSSSHKQESYKKTIELDQVYEYTIHEINCYFILKSDGSYIYIEDKAGIYENEADLGEKENEEESVIYPSVNYTIGTYTSNGKNYTTTLKNSTILYFKNVINFKSGRYFEKESKKLDIQNSLKISSKGYIDQNSDLIKLRKSNYFIPDSEKQFLDQYTYDPSTKDDR
ncbi:Uncharacterised protein [Streptococcus criceti]|uniref:Uncharacterized protein n=1 Tax=Streptococcus criceti HS-6 TaxID=873449 RepID=G5JN95_STRCG|nr:hypothetical protein [Streptococcus criceti]EHI75174.1 hypothetical protein STRCR_0132 [Streptococcus criceti HS-6]SUN41645.1 Uncharacterised protein [Streptococcus criceti]